MNPRPVSPLFILGLLASPLSLADEDRVVREYQFTLEDISEIEIEGSVGEMQFEPGSNHEIRLVLEIEGDDGGWFRRSKDVSEVELESRIRGDRLILSQTEKKTNTTWRILLPAVARTRVQFGVGEINGEFGATALDIHLGVGEVDIELPLKSTGDIDLSVGVGDASVHGGMDVDEDRTLVSQKVRARGKGSFDLRIDLGVGDIDVDLQ